MKNIKQILLNTAYGIKAKLSIYLLFFLSVYPLFGQDVAYFLSRKPTTPSNADFKASLISHAKLFIGQAYEAGTLDGKETESLVINLNGMDCITFVEYALAMESCPDEACISSEILNMRYRNGQLTDYSSRLHYLSEWLFQLLSKGAYSQILGDSEHCFEPELSFMSTHSNFYPELKNNPAMIKAIASAEAEFNAKKIGFPYFSRASFKHADLRHGDILAFKSKTKGLDFDHVGFAIKDGNQMKLLHASLEKKQVIISKETVFDYLNRVKKYDGVVVIR
ncbi:MAG: DUF1460 domain-containing protein [Saprospiraceae bacterium]|nr:DUF1460 domain-containing protein [Saprospiraceae bacterium]